VNANLAICVALLAPWFVADAPLFAQQRKATLPEDPAKAWAEVEKVHDALSAPAEWRTNLPTAQQVSEFQKQVPDVAAAFADKAREFVRRFPSNENVRDARITVVYALGHAMAAGDTNAEKQIDAYVDTVLADKTIPEDHRAAVLLFAGNAGVMKKVGMRLFTEGIGKLDDEFETASIERLRAALKQFPTNSMLYTFMVAVAQRSTGTRQTELANDIIHAPGAPTGAKTLAEHMLKGTKPYQIGKPIEMRFTALDGRQVDLAAMTGKVVLVEFWSTTRGPGIAEMPTVKAAYEKLHDRGFEVIGISLDDKEAALRRFIKEKNLSWPQHFDGRGWENQFAVRYGIFGIPTVWLIDKRGNLRNTEARYNVEQHITSLLAERPSPPD